MYAVFGTGRKIPFRTFHSLVSTSRETRHSRRLCGLSTSHPDPPLSARLESRLQPARLGSRSRGSNGRGTRRPGVPRADTHIPLPPLECVSQEKPEAAFRLSMGLCVSLRRQSARAPTTVRWRADASCNAQDLRLRTNNQKPRRMPCDQRLCSSRSGVQPECTARRAQHVDASR